MSMRPFVTATMRAVMPQTGKDHSRQEHSTPQLAANDKQCQHRLNSKPRRNGNRHGMQGFASLFEGTCIESASYSHRADSGVEYSVLSCLGCAYPTYPYIMNYVARIFMF